MSVSFSLCAQQGKDGAMSVSALNTVVNSYTALTADVGAGSSSFSVASVAGINPGDLVMIIQMQGATISTANDSTWGTILSYNNCGLYEFHEVLQVNSGTKAITFSCPLEQNYTALGSAQVVKVPRYTSLTIPAGTSIVASPWNGASGGVLAVEVSGNMVLDGILDVKGMGFRPGIVEQNTSNAKTIYVSTSPSDGAEKGESIAGTSAEYDVFGGRYGRGAPANGGGGGNAHNAGGGGGSNAGVGPYTGNGNPDVSIAGWTNAWNLEYNGFATSVSSGGGRGGYTFAMSNQNALILGPGNAAWAGDARRNSGGRGGRPLDYSTGRLFLGGGAGAGDANNNAGGNGGSGGGLVFIIACGSVTGSGTIIADGNQGQDTPAGAGGNDAPGGGGGGGTVVINADGGVGGITINAIGGNGGDQTIGGTESEGPGGGGGGGYIALSSTIGAVTRTAAGGQNGSSSSPAVSEFTPNGATRGGAGIANASFVKPIFSLLTKNDTICPGETATLTATFQGATPLNASISWYKTSSRTSLISSGASIKTAALFADTVLYVGACPYSCSTALIPVFIKIDVLPAGLAGNDTSVCSGVAFKRGATANSNYSYSWSPSAGLSSTTVADPVVQISNATSLSVLKTYTVTTTSLITGCVATDAVTVTIYPFPIANAGRDTSVCPNSPALLGTTAVVGNTYSWLPVSSLNNASIAQPIFQKGNSSTAKISSVYTLKVTSVNGCESSDNVTVDVKPNPIANAGKDTAVCSGIAVQLGATSKVGESYSWNSPTNLNSTVISDPTYQYVNSSASPVTMLYTITTTALGCSSNDDVNVTVNPFPVAKAGVDTNACPNLPAQLGASSVAGYTYLWSPSTGLSATNISSPTVQLPNTSINPVQSTYTVKVTQYGCSSFDDVVMTVNPLPLANAGRDSSVCTNSPVTLGSKAIVGNSYAWLPATNLSNASLAQPVFQKVNLTASPITSTYNVKVTSSKGCQANDAVTITVNPNPVANAGRDTTVCSGAAVKLGGSSVSGQSYSWSPATNLNTATIADPTYQYATSSSSPTTTTYTISTTALGCTTTDDVKVTVNPFPNINAGIDTNACPNVAMTLGGASVAGYTYLWSPSTGLSSTTISNPTLKLPNTTSSPIQSTYTLKVTYNGCSGIDDVVATVNPLPAANAGKDTAVCSGQPVALGVASISGYSYSWSPTQYLNSSTISNPVFSRSNTTSTASNNNYTLTVTAKGCASVKNVKVVVNPYPVADAGLDTAVCSGVPYAFANSSSAGKTYKWSPALNLDNALTKTPQFKFINPTNEPQTFKYILNVSALGCESEDSIEVMVRPTPVAYAAPDTNVCESVEMRLGRKGSAGTIYTWSPNLFLDDASLANPLLTIANKGSKIKNMEYVIEVNAQGCKSYDTVEVNVHPKAIAAIEKTAPTCKNDAITLKASGGGNYLWNTGATTSSITIVPTESAYYSVTVSDVCTDKDSIEVEIKNDQSFGGIYIPNAFTPNDDGINDVFEVKGLYISALKVYIFNRWGAQIFSFQGMSGSWDGRLQTGVVQNDVYIYVIEATTDCAERMEYKGIVSVIK
ncbi:MAG: gliding motility-associated C-terminal domain-containing protein [Bacteroidetes bacterium]|nr:gliding motility-associated C-terminal domain-containing protein [Bacteroidota bacterium]